MHPLVGLAYRNFFSMCVLPCVVHSSPERLMMYPLCTPGAPHVLMFHHGAGREPGLCQHDSSHSFAPERDIGEEAIIVNWL